ncbi:metallophosphoesterase [Jeotgalibacillus sp. R-1-5s-1]|uniref:metallophosphoesterase family protein n=1 Tax=Jeotgalibacillus sp. R-1-5s-1 TaxID=2555897 RepID=UPI00106CEEE8|nr:metallophosphoesterase family protein [Jeotgalibacillus sp. R-1-5s-1]TFD95797.1 metallophosphoesterase [Jeotgalibacillus sp. R-1-5s-1]
MKVAIFSDIHGNNYSFERAFNSMLDDNVDYFLFCGDICGYYYNQNEIIDVLRSIKNIRCILGNHDKMFLDIMKGKVDLEFYSGKYGKSFENLSFNITKENFLFLEKLQSECVLTIDGLNIAMFHGTPWDSLNEYCYPDYNFDKYKEFNFDYILQGHTHYRLNKKIGNTHIINPGSLGQPRDGKPPCYVLLDTTTRSIEFISIKYEIEKLISEIKGFDAEPAYLVEVLKRSFKYAEE